MCCLLQKFRSNMLLLMLSVLVTRRCAGGEPEIETSPTCPTGTAPSGKFTLPAVAADAASTFQQLLHPVPLQTFVDKFWEKLPLVVHGRSPVYYEDLVSFGLEDVETVIENGVSLYGDEPYLVTSSDWNIIKRVFSPQDGEFWTAALPPSSGSSSPQQQKPAMGFSNTNSGSPRSGGKGGRVTLEDARNAFRRGGFSVVINRLQRRWRRIFRVSNILERVLGHPVNANLYMTPGGNQGFEAHFDWMDGIIVQLAGSKTWILYDKLISVPRPDQKFKPPASSLGEPIAVLELNPGDILYIPRGWPHEAAVNGTGESGEAVQRSGRNLGPSLHVTFGIEAALSGTYESLLHHALEAAAVQYPQLFGSSPAKDLHQSEESIKAGGPQPDQNGPEEKQGGYSEVHSLPWLKLLHLCVHDLASRDERFRRAVPLAPLFLSQESTSVPASETHVASGSCFSDADPNSLGDEEGATTGMDQVPPIIASEFQALLQALRKGADASSTLALLDFLLEKGALHRVPDMFNLEIRSPGAPSEAAGLEGDKGSTRGGREQNYVFSTKDLRRPSKTWDGMAFGAFDRSLFSSILDEFVVKFLEVASAEAATERMVLAATERVRKRVATSERDLARCGQA